jgi:hypothetical protein
LANRKKIMQPQTKVGSIQAVETTANETDERVDAPGVLVLRALASADGYVPTVDTDGLIVIETPGGLAFLETGHRFTLRDLEDAEPFAQLVEAARREHTKALEERFETLMVYADACADDLTVRFYKEPAECRCTHQTHLHGEERDAFPADIPGWKGHVTIAISEPDGRKLIWRHEPRARVDLADPSRTFVTWMDDLLTLARSIRDDLDFS